MLTFAPESLADYKFLAVQSMDGDFRYAVDGRPDPFANRNRVVVAAGPCHAAPALPTVLGTSILPNKDEVLFDPVLATPKSNMAESEQLPL